ncbi:MAG: proline dehydrogenase family protein [Phycisphaerales bacterium]|jgi:RHH-type proline utilization regulon transcriptional repressor/proline dehydrogenase/delta 1-pyrroline-5-carboxylate dehydrogenase|nr:proline dehydrogenase family protein [Phycisphaerales bacterium]
MSLFTRRSKAAAPPPGATAAATASSPFSPEVEQNAARIGTELIAEAEQYAKGLLSAAFWSDKLMDWAMKDEAFKVQLFRFVDCFPSLMTKEDVHTHLMDYLTQPGVTLPTGMGLGLKAGGLAKGAMTKTVAGRIEAMAKRFIAGTNAASALPELESLWKEGMAFSVDLLGEACVSNAEAAEYQRRYLDLVDNLPGSVAAWPSNPILERDHLGPIPRANVSIKISSLFARTDPIDHAGSLDGLVQSLGPILERAAERNILVNFDMEHYALKDLTLDLFERCCETVDFTAGLAMQAYLRSGDEDAARMIDWARRKERQFTVRLVKGAYWDAETIEAEMHGWPVPVWSRKRDTDACFERMTAAFVDAIPTSLGEGGVKLALGSHNLRSIAVAMALLEQRGLPKKAIELQMLHGMADQLKAVAVNHGMRLREYVPVGEMIPGMAYLVRRLLENTSNESWLRGSSVGSVPPEVQLAPPHGEDPGTDPGVARIEEGPERHALSATVEGLGGGRPFFTEPFRDFAQSDQREAFGKAIEAAAVPSVAIDATIEQANAALDAASKAFPAWRDTPAAERAAMLLRCANIMRSRRDMLAGVMIREAGKTWREADGDVCEAIDFCEYYARQAVGMFSPRRLGKFIGELDMQLHEPRGVAVVISPWNFPLAICCGMSVAALVTGNTTIIKPAEQTPGIAKLLTEMLHEAGVPKEVLHFLPGEGETVGAHLVRDRRTSLIAFTGSKAVGLDIVEACGTVPAGQSWVKRVVCEMGGKNAIIVDTSADLDEAVLGVRSSAFNFQGQKCSACSRVIVVGSAYQEFVKRLVPSVETLVIGDPRNPGTDVGPVIDEEAAAKIRSYIEIGKEEGTLAASVPVPEGLEATIGKPFVGPHVFTGIEQNHRLAREEIFGPVLAVMYADTFEQALEMANDSEYRLTGAVYSRKPSHLDLARERFRVGNLYLNRNSTGALVGRQPFGGFGMSGIGAKAGGNEYLAQFTVPRVVCENTMRRGFAPGL